MNYSPKIQRRNFLPSGRYPVISQEDDLINGYWGDDADLFKLTRPLVIFGDHTKVLKYVDFDFVLGADGVKILQPKDFLIPKYFYYCLQAANLDSLGYARHYKLLKELDISYPARSEQLRIANILDKALDGVATVKVNAQRNLQDTRALLESYLQAVFEKRGQQWEVKNLDQISTNLDSMRVPITKGDRKNGKYPYYGASGVMDYVADYIFDCDALLVSEDGVTLPPKNASLAERLNFGQGERKCRGARGRGTRWSSRSRRCGWCVVARA